MAQIFLHLYHLSRIPFHPRVHQEPTQIVWSDDSLFDFDAGFVLCHPFDNKSRGFKIGSKQTHLVQDLCFVDSVLLSILHFLVECYEY